MGSKDQGVRKGLGRRIGTLMRKPSWLRYTLGISVSLIIMLSGCATSYQPMGYSGGYTERPIKEDVYIVTFKGNGFTAPERVRRYAMYRAAELTKEKGYDYFFVINQSTATKEHVTHQESAETDCYQTATGVECETDPGTTHTTDKSTTRLKVHMKQGSIPDKPNAINPDFILSEYDVR